MQPQVGLSSLFNPWDSDQSCVGDFDGSHDDSWGSSGPMLIHTHQDLFWGVVTSMYIGNAMLLILNLPLIGLWVQVLRVPYGILFPLILLFCLIGSYTLNNNTGDMYCHDYLRDHWLSDEKIQV